jgi:hypothetical protein
MQHEHEEIMQGDVIGISGGQISDPICLLKFILLPVISIPLKVGVHLIIIKQVIYLKEVDAYLEVHVHAGACPYVISVVDQVRESKEQKELGTVL